MALTVGAATVHIGSHDQHYMNLVVALVIAGCKMALIVSFFMHVKYSSKLTQVFAMAGFLWLIIFFVLLFDDYLAREYFHGVLSTPFTSSPYGS